MMMYTGTASRDELRELAKKYGASILITLLNATVAVTVIGVIIYLAVGFLPNGAELGDPSTDAGYLLLMIFNEIASYAIPLAAFSAIFRRELRERTETGTFIDRSEYKYVFGSYVLIFITGNAVASMAGTATSYLSELFNTLLGIPEVQTAFSDAMPKNVFCYAVFELCTCIVAPVCEELLYRHILLKPLRGYSDTAAALVSSLMFALSHFNFDQFLYTFAFGYFLAVIALRSGSVVLPILFHVLNNVMAGISVYMPETFGNEAVDAFFGMLADIQSTAATAILVSALPAAVITLALRLLRLHNNCQIPVKKQLGVILGTPVVIVSVLLCLAYTFYKLYS